MDRLIYTAYSGLTGSMMTQQVIASNMANAQTIGFRAELLSADPMTLKGPSIEARAMTRGEVRGANMKQGALIETGNPLDVALTGRTMLAVQGADGEEAYVLQPPVTIPEGAASITVAPDGTVSAAIPGTAEPSQLGQITIASFANAAGLAAQGDNFLTETAASGAAQIGIAGEVGRGRVRQGFLESSNVNVVEELVDMIETQRAYEVNSKMISAVDEMLKNANQTL